MAEEIPPGTGLIDSIRAEKSPYHSWAGEVVDNAFDAEALVIRLDMTAESLVAEDNGVGITRDRAQDIVKISGHGEMAGTKLGRFGVGIKYKSIQHGREFDVRSVSRDGRLRRRVDWEEIRRRGRWMYPDPVWHAVPDGTPTGTRIAISKLITRAPTKSDIDRTRFEMQRRYYPALEQGRTIVLNGEDVPLLHQPLLTDVVRVEAPFPGNRRAVIFGGFIADPSTKLRQVDLIVDYRVIKPESGFGCNGYGGIRSMFARVDLKGPWKLTKFKDDIAEDPYIDDLEAAVEGALRPVLEKCQSDELYLKTKHLEEKLNAMVPDSLKMARPEKKQDLGRKGPKRKDTRPKNVADATASPTGPVRKPGSARGIMIELADGLHDEFGFGRALSTRAGKRIQLAIDNPYVKMLASARDQQVALVGLYAIAMLLHEGDLQDVQQRNIFPIGLRAWKIASQPLAQIRAA